jgi:hypothetical protein
MTLRTREGERPIGVFVHDPVADTLSVYTPAKYDGFDTEEYSDILEALPGDIRAKALEMGPDLLSYFEDTLSTDLSISGRMEVVCDDPDVCAEELYHRLATDGTLLPPSSGSCR